MDYPDLLADLAERLGGGVEIPAENPDMLRVTCDGLAITLLHLPEPEAVVLTAAVAALPPEDRIERLFRALLAANNNFTGTGGATLALDTERNEVTLCHPLPLGILDADRLAKALEKFATTLRTWRQMVTDYSGAASADIAGEAPEAPSETDESALPPFGFLKV